MIPSDAGDPLSTTPDVGKKAWMPPEIRDQSIASLTEAKGAQNPTEASPSTGPAS